MNFRIIKKVVAVAVAAALALGSTGMEPPVEVMAVTPAPAISAQAALSQKSVKLTWDKMEDVAVTGYRVYRKEMVSGSDGTLQEIATLDVQGNSAKTWKFDFGANEEIIEEGGEEPISCLAEGYTSVSEENAYYTREQGFGFTRGTPTAEGGSLVFGNRTDGGKMSEDVLHGDFATIDPPEGDVLTAGGDMLEEGQSYMEFVVDVPNGEYKVTATHSGFVSGRNISVFWFQGKQVDRHPVNNNIAVSERTVRVTDGKIKICASASASKEIVFPPALSAVTIEEVTTAETGIDADGSFYCKDGPLDLGRKYAYRIVAMKGDVEAAGLNSGDILPVPVPALSVSATTTESVTLAIDNNDVNTDSYHIYRREISEDSFAKVATFTDIDAEGNFTYNKVLEEQEAYTDDDFDSYQLGNGKDDSRNLFEADNGGWTVSNPVKWYVGLVLDKSDLDCMGKTDFLKKSALQNYDGAFMFLAMNNDRGTTFHKKLADAETLYGRTRLKLNFALPNYTNNGITDRGVNSTYLYLADKEITANNAADGYIAKLEYNADDNKIYLNDAEVYDFGTGEDAARSIWNTITLDIDPGQKSISYEFERESEGYLKSGSVAIPDAPQEPQEPEAQEGGEGTKEPQPAAILSVTDAQGRSCWGSIAIDNLKFASLVEKESRDKTYIYKDTNLAPDTEYDYYVAAVADGREVVKSPIIRARTQAILADQIALSKDVLELKRGAVSEELTVIVTPEDATDKSVTWSSEDETIATVEDGVVTGVGAGIVNIIATTANGKSAACEVTVTDVWLSKTTLNLKVGGETTLTAAVKPDFIMTKDVTWDSSDGNIVTVDDGKVKALAAGTAEITVTAGHNGETATCTVNVTKVKVRGITLHGASGNLQEGAVLVLTAEFVPQNTTNKDLMWFTSNEKVATVGNGVVTAVGKGTAVITAVSADNQVVTAAYHITVADHIPAKSVSIKKPSSKKLNIGKTLTLKAVKKPANSTDKLTWKSSNKKIATVSQKGKVKAVGKGVATITVTTASGKKAKIKITVKIPAKKVKLSKTKATLRKGKTIKLKAKMTPANTTDKLTWKTSSRKIAIVKNGNVTAVKKGRATITVRTTSGKTAKCKVTVR